MQKNEALSLLKLFQNDYAEQFGIIKVGLFGSTVREEASNDSDVDIVIETKTPDMFAMVHAKLQLEKLFQTHVDLIRYREKMNPYLKSNIDKEVIFV